MESGPDFFESVARGVVRALPGDLTFAAAPLSDAEGNCVGIVNVITRGSRPESQAAEELRRVVSHTGPEPVTLEEAERQHVLHTLDVCNWVIEGPRGAAARLKVPPSTLRSLMKRLTIHRASRGQQGPAS